MSSAYDGPTFDPDRRPLWIVQRISPSQYGLTCPHCEGKTIVSRTLWLLGRIPDHYENQDIFRVLRSCPYCTQLSRIPPARLHLHARAG